MGNMKPIKLNYGLRLTNLGKDLSNQRWIG